MLLFFCSKSCYKNGPNTPYSRTYKKVIQVIRSRNFCSDKVTGTVRKPGNNIDRWVIDNLLEEGFAKPK